MSHDFVWLSDGGDMGHLVYASANNPTATFNNDGDLLVIRTEDYHDATENKYTKMCRSVTVSGLT